MSKFNLGHKMVDLFNKVFGSKIEVSANGEDKDEPTLFDEMKEELNGYAEKVQSQLSDLQTKAAAHDALQKQVEDLTAEVAGYKTQVETLQTQATTMQSNFNKQLTQLKDEVRTELAKEKVSTKTEVTTTLNEDDPDKQKALVADLWKDANKPKISVG